MQTLDLIDAFVDAPDPAERWRTGCTLFAHLGADWLTFGSAARTRPDQPTIVTTASVALIDDYLGAKLHDVDPWLAHCARSSAIERLRIDGQGARADTPLDPRLGELMRAHGVRHAALIPAVAGARTSGVVAYATSDEGARRLDDPGIARDLRLLSVLIAGIDPTGAAGPGDGARIHVVPRLSLREREVLTWLAAGNRIDRIGEKMGIRPVTVGKHFASAREKLGARTREEALAVAVLRGIVRP